MKIQLLMAVFAVSAYASTLRDAGLFKRQQTPLNVDSKDHSCGSGTGSGPGKEHNCDPKDTRYTCCSSNGFCGNSILYCDTGCQNGFGKCGYNPLEEVYQRQLIGNVPYGKIITDCVKEKTFAIGISNGPSQNTPRLLEMLRTRYPDAKVTFFLESNSRTPIDTKANFDLIRQMHKDGHQIATQGDSHPDFTTLTTAFIQDQFRVFEEYTFKALRHKIPTYFRPPYSKCDEHCLEVTKSMGYHVVTLNSDPSDYKNPDDMTASKAYFDNQFTNPPQKNQGFITVVDDSIAKTVDELIPYAIKLATDHGYKVVTVGDCLDDPKENWYRKYTGDDGTPKTNP